MKTAFWLYVVAMIFFVSGNEPFGLSPTQWLFSWLVPFTLMLCIVGKQIFVRFSR